GRRIGRRHAGLFELLLKRKLKPAHNLRDGCLRKAAVSGGWCLSPRCDNRWRIPRSYPADPPAEMTDGSFAAALRTAFRLHAPGGAHKSHRRRSRHMTPVDRSLTRAKK